MAGAYEFLAPDGTPPEVEFPAGALAVYAALAYDLGVASRAERAWLKSRGLDLPPGWLELEERPQTRIVEKGGVRIGLVVFPEAPAQGGALPAPAVQDILAVADALRPKVDVLLGISATGQAAEEAFLKSHPRAFHLLLGSGPGKGFIAAKPEGVDSAWTRPYTKGSAVNCLRLLALPEKASWSWKPRENIAFELLSLVESVPEDMDVLQALRR